MLNSRTENPSMQGFHLYMFYPNPENKIMLVIIVLDQGTRYPEYRIRTILQYRNRIGTGREGRTEDLRGDDCPWSVMRMYEYIH